jgi:hypothetical protein
MPDSASQAFLRELDKKLWTAADKLRSNLYGLAGLFTRERGDIMVFGQDQWAWGPLLRRAPRARWVRLRRKQPNQSNPTNWRLGAMNMTIRGIDFDFGKEPADIFTCDQHPDLRADFVMALPSAAARSLSRSHTTDCPNGRINPPFNIKEWRDGKLEGDARWKYGTLPQTAIRERTPLISEDTPQVVSEAREKNAHFASVHHFLTHLSLAV